MSGGARAGDKSWGDRPVLTGTGRLLGAALPFPTAPTAGGLCRSLRHYGGRVRSTSSRSISAGDMARLVPATPMQLRSANLLSSSSGAGGEKNRTVRRPASVSASIASVEPVKSSP